MARQGSRQGRLEQLLDRGFGSLDEGDLEAAAGALDKAQRIDRRHPDVLALEGAVASASGDSDGALAAFARLAEVSPDDAMPLINAAMVHLHSRDDAAAALDLVGRGLELVEEEDELIQGILIKAEALIVLGGDGRLAEARATLGELATSTLDEIYVLPLAELWLEAGDADRALALATTATRTPDLAAIAFHLIGGIQEVRGDAAARTAAWLEVRRLDLEVPPPAWTLAEADFDKLAHDALDELPARALELLGNTPILVEPVPSEAMVEDGVDPRSLGLFSGPPLPDHSSVGGGPELTTIHLFQRNLEADSLDEDDLAHQIRITILHETAHFFGLEEEDLEALGLD